jgi:hypothetical protein
MSTPESSPEQHRPGVRSHRIENNYYVVDICCRDGQESQIHFPVAGFDVVNPETNQRLGRLTGEAALQALVEHVATITPQEFDWRNFLGRHDQF